MVSLRLGQDTALTVDLPVIHSRVPRFATLPVQELSFIAYFDKK